MTTKTQYRLAPHIFHRRIGEHSIVLDLLKDKYLSIPRSDRVMLATCVSDFRETSESVDSDSYSRNSEPDLAAILDDFIARGMLVSGQTTVPAKPPRSPDAEIDLTTNSSRRWPYTSALWFLRRAVLTSIQLRSTPLHEIVRQINVRRRFSSASKPFDFETGKDVLYAFNSLRPLYPRPYLCMFDSLLLLHLMHDYSLYPEWVFGVNDEPFLAHCWLQADGVVLNDKLDRAISFYPIMAV